MYAGGKEKKKSFIDDMHCRSGKFFIEKKNSALANKPILDGRLNSSRL